MKKSIDDQLDHLSRFRRGENAGGEHTAQALQKHLENYVPRQKPEPTEDENV